MFASGIWHADGAIPASFGKVPGMPVTPGWSKARRDRRRRGETYVDADKAGAYPWCKAPRYGGWFPETGALAARSLPGGRFGAILVERHGAGVTARVVAA